jgi:hypothetical protein
MRFAYGWTRFVILVGPVAIKIVRLRPLLCIFRLFQRTFQGSLKVRLKKFHANPILGALRYFFEGMSANLSERRVWRETQDRRIAPTYLSIFGIVNIQERGEPIAIEDLERAPFRELRQSENIHIQDTANRANQFALFADGIRLVDYGSHDLEGYISRTSQSVCRMTNAAVSA